MADTGTSIAVMADGHKFGGYGHGYGHGYGLGFGYGRPYGLGYGLPYGQPVYAQPAQPTAAPQPAATAQPTHTCTPANPPATPDRGHPVSSALLNSAVSGRAAFLQHTACLSTRW